MSNAFKIDSFGSRSRRKRITASAQREGSAPSFAQRSASLASTVTRCRLSPRRSRTITSKVNPPPGQGVTVTEGALISHLSMRLVQNHRTTRRKRIRTAGSCLLRLNPTEEAAAPPRLLPACPQRSAVVAPCLRVQLWQPCGGDFLVLTGNQLYRSAF